MTNANNENSFQAPNGQRPSGQSQRPLKGHPWGGGRCWLEPLQREALEIHGAISLVSLKGHENQTAPNERLETVTQQT